ncbi:glycoside hydrolase family 5 protein [Asticcacaulis taihuensis]|uniref:glycoside hydrolase family 5 protein n=1 Tax=Asticcacaulis taihuensis TaxID=260084 RepID=UPI0026F002A8|nr:glycoside hydrolase family 5 protein [Asticcacaulis taihuensis]
MRLFSLLSLAAALTLSPVVASAQTSTSFKAISPEAQVTQMGAGVNVIGGYDAWWDGGQTQFSLSDFGKIRAAGFSTVRIPLFTFKHLDKDGHLDADYFKRIDQVVDAALSNGLTVILDEHDFETCAKDADACASSLSNVWYELSAHFKSAPNSVIFELLNEPNGQVDDKIWNSWLVDLLAIVRETNPERNVIIGPTHWNSRNDLPLLKLPENDRHIIVTFHYYDPFHFTHQGASWADPETQKLSGIRWQGKPEEIAAINADFDKVAEWSKASNRPIFLGEFGAYDKFGKLEDRALWTRTVSESAHKHGFATAYWYWDGGFGVYDAEKKVWVRPILDALIPK